MTETKNVKIELVFSFIRNGASIKQGQIDGGYPITRIETIANGIVDRNKMGYAGINDLGKYEDYILCTGDILMSHINSEKHLGKVAVYEQEANEQIIHGMNLLCLRSNSKLLNYKFGYYFFLSNKFKIQIPNITKKSVNQASFNVTSLKELEITLPPLEVQKEIAKNLDTVSELLTLRKNQLEELDGLIKSVFYDMFGDPVTNEMGWEKVNLNDVAQIDTKMTKDFHLYSEYPHIGIDSIEKNTGEIISYRLVNESNIISGKYIFTPDHIIYSKIRPNLNKVALPNFHGLCSADAYPILTNKNKANKYYLAYTLRSDFFLNYILDFSGRTNIPKVNKKQLEGFILPNPPLSLQNEFATIVTKIEEQKALVKQSIEETQTLFNSLMSQYFD